MGPSIYKWVQYYFSAKCVGFDPFYKVGPINFSNNYIKFRILSNFEYNKLEASILR
jgi:hypothetical protein